VTTQTLGLFDTMLVADEVPDSAALNAALKPAILARRAARPGVKISNIGGWQSEHDLPQWGGDAAQALLRHIMALADTHSIDIRSPHAPRHHWVADSWANVSPPGASNQMHTHPGAFWSAVYYVDDGTNGGGNAQGGELMIEDPRMPMIMMTMPNLRFRKPDGSFNEPQLAFKPKNGRLIMFPGWLNHGVMPHHGPGERISIAVNLMAVPLRA